MATLTISKIDCGHTIGDIVTIVHSNGDYYVGEICKLPKPYNPLYIVKDLRNDMFFHEAEEDIH